MPNSEFVLPKYTKLWIPIHAIHQDPEYYPDPNKFDPERFSPSVVKQRHPLAFLPFGNGPRNCIGVKFAMMQVRVGLISLLRNFKFSPCSRTLIPLQFESKEFVLTPKNGIWLNLCKINVNHEYIHSL